MAATIPEDNLNPIFPVLNFTPLIQNNPLITLIIEDSLCLLERWRLTKGPNKREASYGYYRSD